MNILTIIDPQKDFHDTETEWFKPALPVTGSSKSACILSTFIENTSMFQSIKITMDTHFKRHIAHRYMWVDKAGNHPAPYTTISVDDVANGVWKAANPEFQKWQTFYVEELAKKGKFILMIWPEHCLANSLGFCVEEKIHKAVMGWELKTEKFVNYIHKGSNFKTEHYSAIRAEVETGDEDTKVNAKLIATYKKAKTLWFAGQARSHCLATTVYDTIDLIGKSDASKVFILNDCTNDVSGFEAQGEKFITDMKALGVNIISAIEFMNSHSERNFID